MEEEYDNSVFKNHLLKEFEHSIDEVLKKITPSEIENIHTQDFVEHYLRKVVLVRKWAETRKNQGYFVDILDVECRIDYSFYRNNQLIQM